MKITVIDSTKKKLIGFYLKSELEDINEMLDKKEGILCKDGRSDYVFKFDKIVKLNKRNFFILNSNVSVKCRSDVPIPDYVFGDKSFIIRK
jgi:hypothetical protein